VDMELRHLRYTLAVAQHRSFRRAAEALGVRQSALSRRIRDVEDEIGVSLFERNRDGTRPTAAGRSFISRAQRIVYAHDNALDEAGRAGRAEIGRLVVAFYPSIASGRLNRLLALHRRDWPKVSLILKEASSTDQLAALRERNVDAAFLAAFDQAHGIETQALWTERVYLALPIGHALATEPSIAWRSVADEEFVVKGYEKEPVVATWLAAKFAGDAHRTRIVQHDVSRESLIGMVGIGFGLTIVSEAATDTVYPNVVFRPLTDRDAEITITLAWLADNDNPTLRRLARDCGFLRYSPRFSIRSHPQIRGIAEVTANNVDEKRVALRGPHRCHMANDPDEKAGDPEAKTEADGRRKRPIDDCDGPRRAPQQNWFGERPVHRRLETRNCFKVAKRGHQMSAPPPKEKNVRLIFNSSIF
jgi:DNA-binding transcriptional LysR family regulator